MFWNERSYGMMGTYEKKKNISQKLRENRAIIENIWVTDTILIYESNLCFGPFLSTRICKTNLKVLSIPDPVNLSCSPCITNRSHRFISHFAETGHTIEAESLSFFLVEITLNKQNCIDTVYACMTFLATML